MREREVEILHHSVVLGLDDDRVVHASGQGATAETG